MQYSLEGNDGNKLSLLRVNGIGFSFYGKYRETFIGDYKTHGGYRIIGGERMAWRELLCMFLGLIKWPVAIAAILHLLVLCLK